MKVGIVGLGKMGILHAGILNALPNCSVVAVTEKEGMLNRIGRKLLPQLSFYDNVTSMLKEKELDAIYITTPISTHFDVVDELANTRSNTAIFIEKPLAANYSDAKKIAERAKSISFQNMVGFQKRFSPIFCKAKKMIEEGALGDPLFFRAYSFVSGVFSNGSGWRFKAGHGGALLDLGPHLIDLLLWYFGDIESVNAFRRSFYSKEVDDYVHASLKFKSGLIGSFDVSWSVQGYRLPETWIELTGNNGTLTVTDDYFRMKIFRDVSPDIKAGSYNLEKPDFDLGVDFLIGDPEYCMEDKSFIQSILSSGRPEPSFEDGVLVNKIIAALHNAASYSKLGSQNVINID